MIYDQWLTNEHWIVEDCEFEYCNTYFLNKELRKCLSYFPYVHETSKNKAVERKELLRVQLDKSLIY